MRAAAAARARVRLVPFRRWAHTLGSTSHASAAVVPADVRETADRVGWAVRTAARYAPFEAACLVQATAAKRMLARRGIETTLYLGVCRDESRAFTRAHAWLRCGDRILTGAEGHDAFTVVSTFGEARR